MYWGKSGAADSSSGTSVFDTANGFQAVWHMSKGDTTSESDATVNNFTMAAINGPIDTVGAIGRSRRFNGTNQRFQAANTASSKLNFQMTDSYTLSAWMFPVAITTTANSGHKIIDKGDNQYVLAIYDAATPKYWEITTRGNNAYNQCRSNGTPTITGDDAVGAWHHLVGTYQGAAVGSAIAESLFYDGNLINTWAGTNTNNTGRNLTYNVSLGVQAAGTAPAGTTFTRYWNGMLDEIRMSNKARTPDWIKLEYATQKPGATAVTVGPSQSTSGPPSIALQPQSQSVLVGTRVVFKVAASGKAPFTYKWVRRNTDTVGTNADSLVIASAALSDTGGYKVVVRNDSGVAVSNTAQLGVTTPVAPSISQQPSDQTITVGATIKFGIKATGTSPITYKWVKNNTDTVSGAVTDTLTLTNVQRADSGTYKCVARNVAGTGVSNNARLTVNPVGILPGFAKPGFAIRSAGSSFVFRIPSGDADVRITVVDAWGREVWGRKVSAGERPMDVNWNGLSVNGGKIATGVYVARILMQDAGGEVAAQRTISLKP
ncbi:MAG TPA: hypothetical protein DCQ83_07725 [Fibrobacteres bacterium]|nr:hypothetical protein [Fibrobacterota bacterium]